VLPTPIYAAGKHAISGFVRSLANLEPTLNIRVNAVAPGCVKTPLWTADKLAWADEDVDVWVTPELVAKVMLDLVQEEGYIGGTVIEVGADNVRPVEAFNAPPPTGRGMGVSKIAEAVTNVYGLIDSKFGK
jgi:NAD(P)-dependent dehydrogenase (short-subunit alcohol dehydrogenase family)